MHELSIAMSIVDMATEEVIRLGAARVDAVHLRLGRLSGVVPRALRASFEMATEDTVLAGSRLVIEEIPILVYCGLCDATLPVSSMQAFSCSVCGTPTGDVRQGRELEVTALEIP